MEKEPQNTETVTTEPSHDDLLAQAYADDYKELTGEETPSAEQGAEVTGKPAEDRAPEQVEDTPDNPETSTDKGPARGPDGKFVKKDAEPTEPTPVEPAQPESKYAKAVKDQERLARNRKEFEEEKAQWRQEREQQRREWEEFKRTTAQQPQKPAGLQLNSQQFASASNEFRQRGIKLMREGDVDSAEEQFKLADQAMQAANDAAQTERHQTEEQWQNTWREQALSVIREVPDLGVAGSELSKEMEQLLSENPILGFVPDGLRKGYEILKMRKEAAEVSGLRDENTKLKAEIDRLTKLATPLGGKDTARHSAPQSYQDMPLEQLHKKLLREAELDDATY